MQTGIVIINWNDIVSTLACLRSVYTGSHQPHAVIVIDNGSTEAGCERIKQEFPQTVLLRNSRNVGFAGAANQGAQQALDLGCNAVFFVNNDAVLDSRCLEKLIEYQAQHPKADILGCNLAEPPVSGTNLFSSWTERRVRQNGEISGPTTHVWGCGMLVPKRVFDRCGFFWTGFFAYFEDKEYCWRARRDGFSVHFVKDAIMAHRPSSATGGLQADSPLRAYLVARNRVLFYRMKTPMLATATRIALPLLQVAHSIVFLFFRPNRKSSWSAIYGAVEGASTPLGKWPKFPKAVCRTDSNGLPR